jgi:hypothetical protein
MKKFFIALSVLAALMLSVVPSQALIGVPDNTAGTDAVVPFVCDISGTTGLNTLIMFMDSGLKDGIDFHYTIYTVRSETVYDGDLFGTAGDIVATDAFTEVGNMAPAELLKLRVDLSGDGVFDHYAGYIYYDFIGPLVSTNSVVGQFLFVNLPFGIASSSNIPMKEWKVFPAATAALQAQMAPGVANVEVFTPNAYAGAMALQDGVTTAVTADSFGLYERFFILDQGDATWLMYWFDKNQLGVPGGAGILHLDFWDNDENNVSSNLTLEDELNIINIEPFLPLAVFPANTYPKEGWVDMYWSDNPAAGYPLMTDAVRNLEMLGWTYLQAFGAASESWTVMTQMWRGDCNYTIVP